MDVGKAIYKILNDNIAVSSLVGSKIAPNIMKQTTEFPFIIYDVTVTPEGQKDSVALLDNVLVMVSAYSNSYSEASKLANYIRTALDRVNGFYSGVNIQAIDFDGVDDDFDDMSGSDGVYRKSLDFNVRVLNSFNNIYSTDFDGVDDFVSLGSTDGLLTFKETGSISAWIKLDSVSSSAYIMRMFGDSNNQITLFFHNASSELRMTYKTGGQTKSAVSEDFPENSGWTHVMGTWDSSGEVKVYLNGDLVDTTAINNTFSGGITAGAIGASTSNSNYWKGNLDEISIYERELTAANVTTIYNNGVPNTVAAETNLVGWWRMGDGTLTGESIASFPSIPDESSLSNDGEMTNMTSTDFEADVPE